MDVVKLLAKMLSTICLFLFITEAIDISEFKITTLFDKLGILHKYRTLVQEVVDDNVQLR